MLSGVLIYRAETWYGGVIRRSPFIKSIIELRQCIDQIISFIAGQNAVFFSRHVSQYAP